MITPDTTAIRLSRGIFPTYASEDNMPGVIGRNIDMKSKVRSTAKATMGIMKITLMLSSITTISHSFLFFSGSRGPSQYFAREYILVKNMNARKSIRRVSGSLISRDFITFWIKTAKDTAPSELNMT